MMKTLIMLPLAFLSILYSTEALNVLVLTPMGSKSHKIFFMGIVNALADKGNKVTVLSGFKSSNERKNVIEVSVPELDIMGILSNVFVEEGSGDVIKDLIIDSPRLCNEGLALKRVQDLKKEKFDVILISLFFNFCYLSLVHHFKVPFIYLSSAGMFGPFADIVGAFDFPSIVSNKLLEAEYPLTFTDRLKTIGINFIMTNAGHYYIIPKSEEICREKGLCPPDMPPLHEFNRNVSMIIINSVRNLEVPPRPAMPNVIYAGGAHINPGKPLQNDLEKWILEAGEPGFIFFSLGSGVKPSDMPEKYRKTLVNVFNSLPQRVLWKWDEETMPDLSGNVKLSKWLPQQDILAHKNIKLFITHGGLLSTMEATYFGVPCLGMPLFADQFSNMQEAASEGWARVLLWKDLNENSLKTVINEIISNASLKATSTKRAVLMKDLPVPPAEEAAFWVEFVVRHEGAHHLQSPLFQISWYEFNNVDVWSAITITFLLIIYFVYFLIKAFLRWCCRKEKENIKNKNRRKKEL